MRLGTAVTKQTTQTKKGSPNAKAGRATFRFDKALSDLEALVEQLESGQLGLEDALNVFEKGVKLTRQCQQALDKAQQRVETLVAQHGLSATAEDEGDDEDVTETEDDDDNNNDDVVF